MCRASPVGEQPSCGETGSKPLSTPPKLSEGSCTLPRPPGPPACLKMPAGTSSAPDPSNVSPAVLLREGLGGSRCPRAAAAAAPAPAVIIPLPAIIAVEAAGPGPIPPDPSIIAAAPLDPTPVRPAPPGFSSGPCRLAEPCLEKDPRPPKPKLRSWELPKP